MKLTEIALGSKAHHELVAQARRKKTTITVGEFKKKLADSTMPMMDTMKIDDALDGVKNDKLMTRSDVEQICAIADVDLGEVLDIIALSEGMLHEFARSGDDGDEDAGDWKKLSHKGETVYYHVSPVSFEQRNYGLQVKIALRPKAFNAESVFARNEKIDTYGKTAAAVDDDAIKVVFKYLNEKGTEELAKKMKSWRDKSTNEAKATDTAVKGKRFIVIGNPGNSRPSALYPKTEAPKLYTEADARRLCDKLNDKPFGTPVPAAHWHYKGLDVALGYVSGPKAADAIRKLQGSNESH